MLPDIISEMVDIENRKDYSKEESEIAKTKLAQDYAVKARRVHTINQEFQIKLTLTGINLSVLTQDVLEFGTLTSTNSRAVTPTF